MYRPVIPILDYLYNYDYISQELCENKEKSFLQCNGACYVTQEMKNADLLVTDENSSKSAITIRNLFFPVFIIEKFELDIKPVFIIRRAINEFFKLLNIKLFYNLFFRPPQPA